MHAATFVLKSTLIELLFQVNELCAIVIVGKSLHLARLPASLSPLLTTPIVLLTVSFEHETTNESFHPTVAYST